MIWDRGFGIADLGLRIEKTRCAKLGRIGKPLAGVGLLLVVALLLASSLRMADAADWAKVKSLIGPKDSIAVADPAGRVVIAKHAGKKLVPASILKIFTSLAALHYLGSNHRYATDFFRDPDSNLVIKGYGDPLMISEIVDQIARELAGLIGDAGSVNDIIVDDSYFNRPLTIPGISSSAQPYDAPNGALCVNFNTVFFKRTQSGYASAEVQTPLLPYAMKKIKLLKPKSSRIVLSHEAKEITLYAGHLFGYFLARHGIQTRGIVKPGHADQSVDKRIYRYVSQFTLSQIIAKLLEHSNNFTTNQLLISCGIKKSGQPGNLAKGVAALIEFAADELQIKDLKIVEGSGISRKNKVSAVQMLRVLAKFKSYRTLLPRQGREYYKTGTLHGISTRAGYIAAANGGYYSYVVMNNTAGKSTIPVMRRLLQGLE
ncbi:D-alanyl-D-alanine carboxypeptidase (EC [Olavius algarvensis Delta 1 endosymbiont]|nr:D-alanyl-D-alanine carboxypeptidase (EC [Olavius algarvensis Delta 1 endosymbiont]